MCNHTSDDDVKHARSLALSVSRSVSVQLHLRVRRASGVCLPANACVAAAAPSSGRCAAAYCRYSTADNLLAVVLLHAFCNVMGVPNVDWTTPGDELHPQRRGALHARAPLELQIGPCSQASCVSARAGVYAVLMAAYLVGLVLFGVCLFPLTAMQDI